MGTQRRDACKGTPPRALWGIIRIELLGKGAGVWALMAGVMNALHVKVNPAPVSCELCTVSYF